MALSSQALSQSKEKETIFPVFQFSILTFVTYLLLGELVITFLAGMSLICWAYLEYVNFSKVFLKMSLLILTVTAVIVY